ncbi:hypothetical protein FISHEDRAFT_70362 [Fistulina hepatica ATCC 64428]|uniref:Uncharacterized protein n=1 Tax=Fistulina hepatica ATCC 64428 TaxID=1128425 RepID=A0A0D7AKN9_9AGAR|nr:hypothetical protein FISHEDRAFT_70362 [Fistulina hepatica ATCC 64428]
MSNNEPGILTPVEQETARLKRRVFDLEQEIQSSAPGKRQKTDATTSTSRLGRGLRIICDLFADVGDVVRMHDEFVDKEDETEDEEETDEERGERLATDANYVRLRRGEISYQALKNIIPNIEKKLAESEPEELQAWYALLLKGADAAKSSHFTNLRTAVAQWINPTLAISPTNPPLEFKSRNNRGLSHDRCGYLLSSILHDFNNPEIAANIRAYHADYRLNFFCRVLYQNETGDPTNVEAGFLQGALLVKTAQHILTSPSSVRSSEDQNSPPGGPFGSTSSRSPTRSDTASILKMDNKMTPRAIAFCAVVLVMNLFNMQTWPANGRFQGFNFREFYYFIIDYLEPAKMLDRPRSQRLLDWWSRAVFSDHYRSISDTPASTSDLNMDIIRAHRIATAARSTAGLLAEAAASPIVARLMAAANSTAVAGGSVGATSASTITSATGTTSASSTASASGATSASVTTPTVDAAAATALGNTGTVAGAVFYLIMPPTSKYTPHIGLMGLFEDCPNSLMRLRCRLRLSSQGIQRDIVTSRIANLTTLRNSQFEKLYEAVGEWLVDKDVDLDWD